MAAATPAPACTLRPASAAPFGRASAAAAFAPAPAASTFAAATTALCHGSLLRQQRTATSPNAVAPPGLEPGRPFRQGILKAILPESTVANRAIRRVLTTGRDGWNLESPKPGAVSPFRRGGWRAMVRGTTRLGGTFLPP